MVKTTALTCPGRPAPAPLPALIGRIVDAWPQAAGLDPELALLRGLGEAEPKDLFKHMAAECFRPLQAQAFNTQKAYGSDWRVFVRFCAAAGFRALPATPSALEALIEWSLPVSTEVAYKYVLPESSRRKGRGGVEGVTVATVERALKAIGAVHRWLQYPDPSAHPNVAHTLKINTRDRPASTPQAPLPYSAIERATGSYDPTSLKDLRDLAVVTVGWSTGLRRAELARLRIEDLDLSAQFDDALVRVTRTKGNHSGRLEYRYVSDEARQHLERWLAAARLVRGPVFRGLNRNGQLRDRSADAKPLHPNQIALIVKALSRRASLSEPEVARLSAHSLRIGASQALRAANYTSGFIALDLGWTTEAMVNYYNRNRDVRQGAMAQWFRARGDDQKHREEQVQG